MNLISLPFLSVRLFSHDEISTLVDKYYVTNDIFIINYACDEILPRLPPSGIHGNTLAWPESLYVNFTCCSNARFKINTK